MSEEEDYDLVIGKVPGKDKYGNDITGDKHMQILLTLIISLLQKNK